MKVKEIRELTTAEMLDKEKQLKKIRKAEKLDR